jgi:hypothetical protein
MDIIGTHSTILEPVPHRYIYFEFFMFENFGHVQYTHEKIL